MANEVTLIDTSVLIDYYRKTDKANSFWMNLIKQNFEFVVSTITKYKIYSGATQSQLNFWDKIFKVIRVISFDENAVDIAVNINADLKRKKKQIDLADLFIAATAISHNFPIATLNKKHFSRIETLHVL